MPQPPLFINPVDTTQPSSGPSTGTPLFINPTDQSIANQTQPSFLDNLWTNFKGSFNPLSETPNPFNLDYRMKKAISDEIARKNPEEMKNDTARVAATMASMATGAPVWSTFLTGLTAKNQGDAAADTALNLLIPGASRLKTAYQGTNMALGAAKGYALHKLGQYIQSGVNGTPSPTWYPSTTGDVFGGGVSALAGATEGVNAIPAGLTKFQTKMNAWLSHQKDIQNAEGAMTSAKRAFQDSDEAVNTIERTQRPQSKLELKGLTDQISEAEAKASTAGKAVQDHQEMIAGKQKGQAVDVAESLDDQILALKERLRNLNSQYETTAYSQLQPEDLTEGAKAALKLGKGIDSDNLEASVAQAKTNVQNKLDQLRQQQRRANQQRDENTYIDPKDYAKLAELQNNHIAATQELADLNKKYAKLATDQLTHAAAGQGPVADISAVQAYQAALTKRGAAKTALRQSEDKLTDLKNTAPAKPNEHSQEMIDKALGFVKATALPTALTGLVSHAEGGSPHITEALMAAMGLASRGLQHSETGQRLINAVNAHLGKTATRAIPAIVNQSGH